MRIRTSAERNAYHSYKILPRPTQANHAPFGFGLDHASTARIAHSLGRPLEIPSYPGLRLGSWNSAVSPARMAGLVDVAATRPARHTPHDNLRKLKKLEPLVAQYNRLCDLRAFVVFLS
jgi:hypothetical protein